LKRFGVLALQGDFREHTDTLKRLSVQTQEVRTPEDLSNLDGIILPGGESTTMAHLLQKRTSTSETTSLASELILVIKKGLPVWGTCAGMIMLARELIQNEPVPLGLMDITVNRNAFGRQNQSFEQDLNIPAIGVAPFKAIFIRAPTIVEMDNSVTVLARLEDSTPIAAQQKNILVTAFHPELTTDDRFHQYFIEFAAKQNEL
jgi:5'-phosphate synthase pdxT subunit